MSITCIDCGDAELVRKGVKLSGKVRDEEFVVSMPGFECPLCGYRTIDGKAMPEFGRLLADEYRSTHGLLTSQEIRQRRKRSQMSQDDFARYLGVGVASVKRWESGKIQEPIYDQLIRRKTDPTMTALEWDSTGLVAYASTVMKGHGLESGVFLIPKLQMNVHETLQMAVQSGKCGVHDYAMREHSYSQTMKPYLAHLLNEEDRATYDRRR